MTKTQKQYLLILIGGVIFPIGVNLFIAPYKMYNGGVIGIAQILRTFLQPLFQPFLKEGMDIAGIINFILNVPLMIIAYKGISKSFFFKSAFSIAVQTIVFSYIPANNFVINDVLTSIIIGGIVSGVGVGITLQAGGCCGGTDVLGVYYSIKKPGITVGKLTSSINVLVYSSYALLFNLETAIYSVIYAVILALICDRYHHQNINVAVTIVTKNKNVYKEICSKLTRGVTYWNGFGGFEDKETHVIMTVISKFEMAELKRIVYAIDDKAFITFSEGLSLAGNFEKRLI